MSETNSTKEAGCVGCEYRFEHEGEFCYMFDKKPDVLPCTQHTKLKDVRKRMALQHIKIAALHTF